uniref:NADH-ubiquinone oxidoreductase chain 2 n=1 Tax=Pseudorhynchus crassiceps TaxID=1945537 RepID=A0A1Q1MPM9_9ORTH|nr:NADH dehydrogenase subunit 2 [Pseudorhynchus crassiceps]AQM40031.1 NADH dehydrogenase subunit 2 [Pseudorhynchus crassiceps]
MSFNPPKMMFLICLISGTLISVSSNSWMGVWMGLEINLLSFIPLMIDQKNILTTESSLKYFLIQAFASTILLFSVISSYIISEMNFQLTIEFPNSTLISSALLLKMGAAPFHFWFPGTMEGLNWWNCLILMTWQKIAPMILLSYTIQMNTFFISIMILCTVIGSLGGLNQTSLRKLMAYSSINHLGWMITALMMGENLWIFYFLMYTFLSASIILLFNYFNIYHMNQNYILMSKTPLIKFFLFSSLLSLGGLPPFLGFLPKWIIIQAMSDSMNFLPIIIMVTMTLITLLFYLRVTFSALLLAHIETSWNKTFKLEYKLFLKLILLTATSLLGLTLTTLFYLTL